MTNTTLKGDPAKPQVNSMTRETGQRSRKPLSALGSTRAVLVTNVICKTAGHAPWPTTVTMVPSGRFELAAHG